MKITFPAPHPKITHYVDDASHETTYKTEDGYTAFHRQLDNDHYFTTVSWESDGNLTNISKHSFILTPENASHDFHATFSFYSQEPEGEPLSYEEVRQNSTDYWQGFWESGAVIELNDSKDPRAFELERRIVLSQFLTAIQCSGSLPPQETGLVYNSWFGKFHLEMHWWHAFHFILWGRSHLFKRSFDWYKKNTARSKENR